MKTTLFATLALLSAVGTAFCADITTNERSENYPDGKRTFVDYYRNGRLILTKMWSPEEDSKYELHRSVSFYLYDPTPIKGTDQIRPFCIMSVLVIGNHRIKYFSLSQRFFWGGVSFVDYDGDGQDDVIHIEEAAGKNNGNKSRLIEAFTITKRWEIAPMDSESLLKEKVRYEKENNRKG